MVSPTIRAGLPSSVQPQNTPQNTPRYLLGDPRPSRDNEGEPQQPSPKEILFCKENHETCRFAEILNFGDSSVHMWHFRSYIRFWSYIFSLRAFSIPPSSLMSSFDFHVFFFFFFWNWDSIYERENPSSSYSSKLFGICHLTWDSTGAFSST